jgi:hypothetical protein
MAASRVAWIDLTEIAAMTAEQIRASFAWFLKEEPGCGSRYRNCWDQNS